jgi:pyoverdine/dityrosine biosynthesis protein Dit1
MNLSIAGSHPGVEPIRFRSLPDLLHLNDAAIRSQVETVDFPSVTHFLDTKLGDEAELSRKILIDGFGPDPAVLRSQISGQDPSVLALYRGFTKFMLEDLDRLLASITSRSQRRKLSSKVAFEMINVSAGPRVLFKHTC